MADIRQTAKYAKYLRKIGWQIEKVGKNYFYIKKILPIGSIVKIQRPEEIDLDAIEYICKKHNVIQTVIEPKNKFQAKTIRKRGYKVGHSPYLPSKTLHLDLERSVKSLFENLEKDARYCLRKTKDLKIYSVENPEKFRDSWKKATSFRRFIPSAKELSAMLECFGSDAVFLITPDGESGAIFLFADQIGYYWQAFSSKVGRKKLAQYKTVWTGINWAKQKGAKFLDFEGIYDKRFPNKRWRGFTHFKQSFGGYEVNYPGAFVKIGLPK